MNSDPGSGKVFTSCPDLASEDVDAIVQSSQEAFRSYRVVNPRTRAEMLLKWHQLIRDARDDLATILTYETGKPLIEAYGEIDYATGFTWWFAGEAERIRGEVNRSLRRSSAVEFPNCVSQFIISATYLTLT